MKKTLLNLGMVIFSLALTLLVSEVALRIFGTDLIPLGEPSRELGYIGRANIHSTRYSQESEKDVSLSLNDKGFLDRPWEFHEDELRIVVLGDSFVEANQVEFNERFTQLLESKYLASGASVRVYNLSLSGTGPETHLLYLKKYFEVLQPDIVVQAIFNGNDFENVNHQLTPNSGRVTYEVINGEVIAHKDNSSWQERFKWEVRLLLGKLYLAQLTKQAQVRFKANNHPSTQGEVELKKTAPLYCDKENKNIQNSFLIMEHILQEMKIIAGDKLVVLQIPDKDQVSTTAKLDQLQNCNPDQPEEKLKDIATRHDIRLIQMTPIMRREGGDFYWSHLNYEGHRLVANALYDYLTNATAQNELEVSTTSARGFFGFSKEE